MINRLRNEYQEDSFTNEFTDDDYKYIYDEYEDNIPKVKIYSYGTYEDLIELLDNESEEE